MSIEETIKANTAAMIALTAVIVAAGSQSTGATATGDKTAAGKDKTAAGKADKVAKAKGPTVEEMQGALTEVKEKIGSAEAKKIIKKIAGVDKMAEIPEDKIAAVFQAAKAALEGGDDTGSDDDDI